MRDRLGDAGSPPGGPGPLSSSSSTVAGLKAAAQEALRPRVNDVLALSHDIHAHPETAFDEVRSAERTAGLLSGSGFDVASGVAGLPTAFVAESGKGPLVVAICAEYDALPDVGHACGHNIIAASAVGAAIGLAAVADDIGLTVRVVGTPAEEGGGGKVILLDHGTFSGVHAAMMVHPWPTDRLSASCLAVSHFDVHFTGKAAHASAAPWEGVNAGDALVIAQVAIGLLRQQLPPGSQVHGIALSGGSAANIVPSSTSARFMVRSTTVEGLSEVEQRVRACFDAGALATGADVRFSSLSPVYTHMESDAEMLRCYRANAETLGRSFADDDLGTPLPTLSTDMANVSLAVPTIHPMLGIDAAGSVNHQPEFAAACITDSADLAVRDGALAMAWTGIDLACDPELRRRLLRESPG